MNRRKLISNLAALPIIGFLFRPAVGAASAALDPSFLPSGGAVLSLPYQNKTAGTIPICLHDLSWNQDKTMVDLCNEITIKIREILEECEKDHIPIRDICVRWTNIPDSEFNPDGQMGACRITALRGNYWPHSGTPIPPIVTNGFKEVRSAV